MSAFATPVALRASARAPQRLAVCRAPAARPARRAAAPPRMVLADQETQTGSQTPDVPIRITGNNLHLTDALTAHITDKLGKVGRRFAHVISKMDVHLTVDHNPSIPARHKAEVIAHAGKTILRTEVRSDDMYAAVDAVEERIARTIRKFKERRINRAAKREGAAEAEAEAAAPGGALDDADEAEEDGFRDVYQDKIPGVPAVTDVVRRKVFPMPLQTVEEAVLCCEYVDHPWYLFRNAETNEISLVYRRNHGGYGLIEPSNPSVVDGEPL